jgi:hypothetical protein
LNVTLFVKLYLRKGNDKPNEADWIYVFLVALFDVRSFDHQLSEQSQNRPATDSRSRTEVVYVCACLKLFLHD